MSREEISKVVVLGVGGVASDVARRVHTSGLPVAVTVADLDVDRAQQVAADIGLPTDRALRVDVTDPASVNDVVAGADLVFNGVGPYFRFGLEVVRQAVEAGAHYVDVCDEYDIALQMVTDDALDQQARDRGLTVLTGMGISPGITNLLARWAVDQLDKATSVETVIGLPLIVDLGRTLNEHVLHSLSGEVTQWLDGEYVDVPAWSDPREFRLLATEVAHAFGFWGHPEAVTLPRFIPSLTHSTSRFSWFQASGNQMYRDLEDWGLLASEPTPGMQITPLEFMAAHMSSKAGSAGMQSVAGSAPLLNVWQVVVSGTIDGADTEVVLEASLDLSKYRKSDSSGMTGIPAAMAVQGILNGRITRRGVVAPEACIDPEPFVRTAYEAIGANLRQRVTTTSTLVS